MSSSDIEKYKTYTQEQLIEEIKRLSEKIVDLGWSEMRLKKKARILSSTTNDLSAYILDTPTASPSADLTTARQLLTTNNDTTLEKDIKAVNLLIDGNSNLTGSNNTVDKIGIPAIDSVTSNLSSVIGGSSDIASRLGDPVVDSLIQRITNKSSIADALGNNVVGRGSIGSLLKNQSNTSLYDMIVGNNGILYAIDGSNIEAGNVYSNLLSQIQEINGQSTRLDSSISLINDALGGSFSTYNRVLSAMDKIDGVVEMTENSLTVTTVAANNSGIIQMGFVDDNSDPLTYSFTFSNTIPAGDVFVFTETTNEDTIRFVNTSANDYSASGLTGFLQQAYPVGTTLKKTLNDKVVKVKKLLNENSNIAGSIARIYYSLKNTPGTSILNDLETIRNLIVPVPSSTLETDIQTINSLLDSTSTGTTQE